MNPLSVSLHGKGLTKKGDLLITFMSAFRLGHAPISSLKLKASLYLGINFISFAFSFEVRWNETDLFSHKEFVDLSEINMDHLVPTKDKGQFFPSVANLFFSYFGYLTFYCTVQHFYFPQRSSSYSNGTGQISPQP